MLLANIYRLLDLIGEHAPNRILYNGAVSRRGPMACYTLQTLLRGLYVRVPNLIPKYTPNHTVQIYHVLDDTKRL